jgi:hypothetical protein
MEQLLGLCLKKCEKNIRFKRLTGLSFLPTRRPALGAPVAIGKVTNLLFSSLCFFLFLRLGVQKWKDICSSLKMVLILNELEICEAQCKLTHYRDKAINLTLTTLR